jgi:glycopeptide antibiotics resistance protein
MFNAHLAAVSATTAASAAVAVAIGVLRGLSRQRFDYAAAGAVMAVGSVLDVLVVTLSSESDGSTAGLPASLINKRAVNLVPFRDLHAVLTSHNQALAVANIGGNVAIFIPPAFLLAVLAIAYGPKRALTTTLLVVGALVVMSMAIECIQYGIGRSADVDDVILDAGGAAVGGVAALIAHGIGEQSRRHASADTE